MCSSDLTVPATIAVEYACVVIRHPQMPFVSEASRKALHDMRTCTFNALSCFAQVNNNNDQAQALASVWAPHLPQPEVCDCALANMMMMVMN